MPYRFAVLLLALLPACQTTPAPEAPAPGFSTDRGRYAPGEEVQLHLENRTDQTIGYNLCFSGLQRQAGQGWEPVHDPETVCTAIQHGLEPGERASYARTLKTDLPGGTYRFITEIEHRGTGRQELLATEAFTVEG